MVRKDRDWGHARGGPRRTRRIGRTPDRRARFVSPVRWTGVSERRRVRVADLELDVAAGNPEAVLCHADRGSLADDVVTDVDPRAASQLEPDARGFRERALDSAGEARRLEHDQSGADAPRVRRQPTQDALVRRAQAPGQVDHEEVDRPSREQSAAQREPFRGIRGTNDHEPVQVDPTADRLERIEGIRQVEERDDCSGRLGFRDPAQCKRRLAARLVAADRRARLARQATRPEDSVERRKAAGDDVAPCWRSVRLAGRVLGRPAGLRRQCEGALG